MIVVIDGPAGSGKSSTAREVADRCGLEYVDSGALYRVAARLYLNYDGDDHSFSEFLNTHDVGFRYQDETFKVFLNGTEITDKIRTPEVSETVSAVAAMPQVREFVNNLMRSATDDRKLIADGRDLGTAVFPDADLKFFMVADLDTRAERRYREMKDLGYDTSLEDVKHNIKQRDLTDSTRTASPLTKADDAIEIDTTNLSFDEQVEFICGHIRNFIA